MERVAIVARLKEVDGQPRVARERFGWQLDEAESVTAAAGNRSESWA
jgi:hypothetical protein